MDAAERGGRDPLTGLQPGRAFDPSVGYRAAIWIDVDQVKGFCDRCGHAAGDLALARIAHLIRDVAGDEVTYRVAGDEFVVALPTGRDDDVAVLAERLRAGVEAAALGLTISAGYVVAPEPADGRTLVEAAEKWQYQAKALGRNRVIGVAR
jgi:two-component system, cell cycle response regulator